MRPTLYFFVAMITILHPALTLWGGISTAMAIDSDGSGGNSSRRNRAELIMANGSYYYGVGYGLTQEEADEQSILDLCKKISMVVSHSDSYKITEDSESFTSQGAVATFVTLSNTERFDINTEDGKWEIIRYVERAKVENDMKLRQDKICALVFQGIELEKKLEIASALKYFSWAYAMARTYASPVSLQLEDMNTDAKTWLNSHINSIFSSLKIELDNVEQRPNDLDPFLVNLKISFLGQPVGDLDFSYINNGNRVRDQHVKNGRASLSFEKLPIDKIELSIAYKYETEGIQFDPELAAIYQTKRTPSFPRADFEISCKGTSPEKFCMQESKMSKQDKLSIERDNKIAPAIAASPRKRIQVEAVSDDKFANLVKSLTLVSEAITSKKYSSVEPLFTQNGYTLFLRMMQSGKVNCAKTTPDWKIERAGDYFVGKSIPVTIKYNGGHTVAEEIVCRFNMEDKIESVAYSLSKRAEDDIFRQNSWNLDARYAILKFMEDYQTAYALKRIDYIEKIFSDDAVIISGRKNANSASVKSGDEKFFLTETFTYTRESKEEFINRLKRDFPLKKYIKLTFEDNEIREQSGIYNNIFWIEIKQFYSSSNYNDDGYLTLMIDMRDSSPTIKVRTWAPGKIPLSELMSRYTIE